MFAKNNKNVVMVFDHNRVKVKRIFDATITNESLEVDNSNYVIMPNTTPINPKTGDRYFFIGDDGNERQTFNPGVLLQEVRVKQKENIYMRKLHNEVMNDLRQNALKNEFKDTVTNINKRYREADFETYEWKDYPNKLLAPKTQQAILTNNLLKGFASNSKEKLMTFIIILLLGLSGGVPIGMYFGGDSYDNSSYDIDNNYPENKDNDTIIINYMGVLSSKINLNQLPIIPKLRI